MTALAAFKDRGRGPVILFEFDDLDFRKMLLHVQEIRDFGAAPAIDALVVIAYDAQVAVFLRKGIDEFELRRVGVLILVHHHVAVFLAAGFQRGRVFR